MSKISQLDGGAIDSGTGSAVAGVAPTRSVGSGAAGSSGPDSAESSGSESSESVTLTSSGLALAAISQAVQQSPEVDGSRVATLRQAIESGSYTVDNDAIAGGMLQIEQDLGGTAQ